MSPTSADAPSRLKAAAIGSEPPTSAYKSVQAGPRWLIQVDGGEFQLVESEAELAELVRLGRVTATTPVYAVGEGPWAVGEIFDLVPFAPRTLSSEPPIRRDHRSPERAMLSEELAILNRPLEDEIEYYDAPPVRHWPRRLAFLLALAAAAFGGYLFALPSVRSSVLARVVLPARSWVGSTSPAGAAPAPPAVLAVGASAERPTTVAPPAVVPTPAVPPVPAPAALTDTTASPTAANDDLAPSADRQVRTARAHKEGRSERRHSSRSHPTSRR